MPAVLNHTNNILEPYPQKTGARTNLEIMTEAVNAKPRVRMQLKDYKIQHPEPKRHFIPLAPRSVPGWSTGAINRQSQLERNDKIAEIRMRLQMREDQQPIKEIAPAY